MSHLRADTSQTMLTYRTRICLPAHYWRILQLQAAGLYVDGRQVIEDILKSWCAAHLDMLAGDEPDEDDQDDTEEAIAVV